MVGFGVWVLGFDGKSEMGDLELDNLMRKKEEEGGEAERLMIMVYFMWFSGRGSGGAINSC